MGVWDFELKNPVLQLLFLENLVNTIFSRCTGSDIDS